MQTVLANLEATTSKRFAGFLELAHMPRVFKDHRGRLDVLETGKELPYPIERLFFISDVPGGTMRANHAHRTTGELLHVTRGTCRLTLDDGWQRHSMILDSTSGFVQVKAMTWIILDEFAANTHLMVAASNAYDPTMYIEDYDVFLRLARDVG